MKILLVAMALDIGGAETHVYDLALGLQKKDIELVVVSNGGIYQEALIKKGIQCYEAPLNKVNVKNIYSSIRILNKIINKENIDIIHAHARIPAFVSNILSKKLKIPYIVTVHAKFKCNFVYRRLSYWGDRTICISEDIKDYVINTFKVNNSKIEIISNGIDTDLFDSISNNRKNDISKVICVSRLDEYLGIYAESR